MGIKLRTGEEIKSEVNIHWSAFILPGLWAFLGTPSLLISLFGSHETKTGTISPWMAVIFYGPLIYTFLKNKSKAYVITNERIYIEEGILAKSKKDIPLEKVNDFELTQGFVQRLFGAGNVMVLTGNSKPTKLTNIDSVDDFRETASALIATRRAG